MVCYVTVEVVRGMSMAGGSGEHCSTVRLQGPDHARAADRIGADHPLVCHCRHGDSRASEGDVGTDVDRHAAARGSARSVVRCQAPSCVVRCCILDFSHFEREARRATLTACYRSVVRKEAADAPTPATDGTTSGGVRTGVQPADVRPRAGAAVRHAAGERAADGGGGVARGRLGGGPALRGLPPGAEPGRVPACGW